MVNSRGTSPHSAWSARTLGPTGGAPWGWAQPALDMHTECEQPVEVGLRCAWGVCFHIIGLHRQYNAGVHPPPLPHSAQLVCLGADLPDVTDPKSPLLELLVEV